jgi:hypothetical protein
MAIENRMPNAAALLNSLSIFIVWFIPEKSLRHSRFKEGAILPDLHQSAPAIASSKPVLRLAGGEGAPPRYRLVALSVFII